MTQALKVAVVGGDAGAWLAAAALVRAMRHRGVRVTLIDTGAPDMPAGDWTLPSTRAMHRLLGIKEGDFLRATGASFRLGSEHQGWQGEGSSFVHSHGSIGKELHGIPFYKLLMSRRMAGDAIPTEAFSLASAALKRGRFARPEGVDGAMTASFTYGYHLRLTAYTALLREHARASGVQMAQGPLATLHRDEFGNLQGITLADGTRVDADLFVDCSGRRALLMSQLPRGERLDWSANLPCDRMLTGIGPGPTPATDRAATETRATDTGWSWRLPLAGACAAGHVYQSNLISDDQAAALLRQTCGVTEPLLTRFHSGRRQHFWVGNVVALGEAAMDIEPLVGANLHFLQLGLGALIELFPLEAATPMDAEEYNRVMAEQADAIRDFTLAHYLCATRAGALWEQARTAPVPERLAGRMDLFKANGRILTFDHETFEETDWAMLFLGSGWLPQSLEAQTLQRLARITSDEAGVIADQVRGLSESMPPHQAYLLHASQSRAR